MTSNIQSHSPETDTILNEVRADIADVKTEEAIKKEENGEQPNEDRLASEILLEDEELINITPAQFFDTKKNVAFFAVPSPRRALEKTMSMLITSNRERFPLTEAKLLELGYVTDRKPKLKQRWSWQSINRFLAKQSTGTIAKGYVDILQQLEHHVDIGAYENIETLALWSIGTYMYRMFPAFPYIHLNGMPEAGKSKTLQLVSLVAFNGCMGTETTPAALVKLTHDNHATLCLDEIEKLQSAKDEMSQASLAILNVGYKRESSIQKLVRVGSDWELKEFDPYSPKILAGVRGLEPTLASRCISMMLIKSEDEAIVNRELDSEMPIWGEIRDTVYEGILSGEWLNIRGIYLHLKDTEIKGRNWETWKPLLAIAKYIDRTYSGLYERIRNFAIEHSNEKGEIIAENNSAIKIMLALHSYVLTQTKQQVSFVAFSELLDYLVTFDPETFCDSRSRARHSWMTGRWLASELRKCGIMHGKANQGRVFGKNVKGFNSDYTELKKRMRVYGLNPSQGDAVSNTDGTGLSIGNQATEATQVEIAKGSSNQDIAR